MANALREWLPLVLQYVQPWVSDKDISAGERWAQSIAGELDASNFGIICITPENRTSEWILFETGALSKSMLDAKVIPLLFGLELSDLTGPLSQFQAQKAEESGVMEIVRAINKVADNKTSDAIVSQLVPKLWPTLQNELAKIPPTEPKEKHMRPQHEILEELVTGVRGLSSQMRELGPEYLDRDRYIRRRKMRIHPGMLHELAFMSEDSSDSPTLLLFLAGIYRDDLPWFSELLLESYREIRDAGPEERERSIDRLRKSIRNLNRGPIMHDLVRGSKEAFMMMEELPMILEMAFSRSGRASGPKSLEKTDNPE
jgi:hypothetical protein